MIEFTISLIVEGVPLTPDPRKEPYFFRKYFKPWVREGLKELAASQKHDGIPEI